MFRDLKLKAFDLFATWGTLAYALGVVLLCMAILPYALIPYGSFLGIAPWVYTVNRWHNSLVNGKNPNQASADEACGECRSWCLASTTLNEDCVCDCDRHEP